MEITNASYTIIEDVLAIFDHVNSIITCYTVYKLIQIYIYIYRECNTQALKVIA